MYAVASSVKSKKKKCLSIENNRPLTEVVDDALT